MTTLIKKIFILLKLFSLKNLKFVNGSFYNNNDSNHINIIDVSNFLYDNCLQDIQDEVFNRHIPLKINLSFRKLTYIPPKLKLFENLVSLNLSYNSLQNICELPISLKSVFLNDVKMKFLPEHFSNLVNLEILELRNNLLSEFPKSIIKLSNLIYLDLSFNNISEIHPNIRELIKLEKFILTNNKIIKLPDSINKLLILNIKILINND